LIKQFHIVSLRNQSVRELYRQRQRASRAGQ
jgi:hypothetical protein